MEDEKKRILVKWAACAAKMASLPIKNPFLQSAVQEGIDQIKDKELELIHAMPQVEPFMKTCVPAVQQAVWDVLAEGNLPDETEILASPTPQKLAETTIRQSKAARQLLEAEEQQVQKVLVEYFSALKSWAAQNSELLVRCLDDIKAQLDEQKQQISALSTKLEQSRANTQQETGARRKPMTELMEDDQESYCEKYEEVLFLHRNRPKSEQMTLKDVYVLPGAVVEKAFKWNRLLSGEPAREPDDDKIYDSAAEAIRDFLEYTPPEVECGPVDILFLEGQAAMGKSSLTAWLCWQYKYANADKDAAFAPLKDVLQKRRLIVVRLRELPETGQTILNVEKPLLQLCDYLLHGRKSMQELQRNWKKIAAKLFRDTFLILEGFDELCMMEGVVGEGKQRYFYSLRQELLQLDCNCKVMVTTRPEYLDVEPLDFLAAHLFLQPFGDAQRKAFVEKYEQISRIEPGTKASLLQHQVAALEGIIDSPLTLYMAAARNVQLDGQSNLWKIYHDIFADEVYQRSYEWGASHAIQPYRQQLYRLTAEIANAISREQHLSITVEKLLDVKQVGDLLDTICTAYGKEKQQILKDCYALASYFHIRPKKDAQGKTWSAVEFYHNNIKDYFYCEYLWMKLQEIYAGLPAETVEQEWWFLHNFQNLFQYAIDLKEGAERGDARAFVFLEGKVRFFKESGLQENFIQQELQQHYFRHFFGKMLQTGFVYSYEYTGKENLLDMMACIYVSVFSVYHAIYLPHLAEGERIELAEETELESILKSSILNTLLIITDIRDLSYVCFDGLLNLNGKSFRQHDLRHSSFRGCLLDGCDFSNCDLRGADFSGTALPNTDLSDAVIDETTVFSHSTVFGRTRICAVQERYFLPYTDENKFYAQRGTTVYIGRKH